MGLIITLITSAITRSKRKKAKQSLVLFVATNFINKLPHSIFKRGIIIDMVPVLVIALPIIIMLMVFNINQLISEDYIIYHAFYAAMVAGMISYCSTSRTLAEKPQSII